MARKSSTSSSTSVHSVIIRRSTTERAGNKYNYPSNRFSLLPYNPEIEERVEVLSELPFFNYRERMLYLLQCNTAFRKYGPAFYQELLGEVRELIEDLEESLGKLCGIEGR